MKQCPACNRTYTDDGLSFCLEDGAPLNIVAVGQGEPTSIDSGSDPYKTLAYTSGRDTSPPPVLVQTPAPASPISAGQHPWNPGTAPSYGTVPSRTSGKGWIIGAIIGVAVLGIGIVVLLMIIGNNSTASNSNANRIVVSDSPSPPPVGNTNNTNRGNTTTSSGSLRDDFSTENWPTGEGAYGSFYQDGEYHMTGKPKLYVYMFPRNSTNYKSDDATVKVTTRSIDGKSPEFGYGLVIHGKINQSRQLEGYGFLIYTGSPSKFEIVRFVAGEPKQMVAWRESSAIRAGTMSNQIEVRTSGSALAMYVNGQFVDSITDTAGVTGGYVGLYTSETNEVAFDDLEIER